MKCRRKATVFVETMNPRGGHFKEKSIEGHEIYMGRQAAVRNTVERCWIS